MQRTAAKANPTESIRYDSLLLLSVGEMASGSTVNAQNRAVGMHHIGCDVALEMCASVVEANSRESDSHGFARFAERCESGGESGGYIYVVYIPRIRSDRFGGAIRSGASA